MKVEVCDFSRAEKSPAVMEKSLAQAIEKVGGTFRSALISESASTGRVVLTLVFGDKAKAEDSNKVKVKVFREPSPQRLTKTMNEFLSKGHNVKVLLQTISAKSNNLLVVAFYEEK